MNTGSNPYDFPAKSGQNAGENGGFIAILSIFA
jgi:hypothetical protein